jgi:multiple sugar transport system permease protein
MVHLGSLHNRWKKNRKHVGQLVVTILVVLIFLLPALFMCSIAFKPLEEVFQYPPRLMPKQPTWNSFALLFAEYNFGTYFLNSGLVTALTLGFSLFLCSLGGFAFAKYDFPGRNVIFIMLLATMIVPFHATMIPVFLLLLKLGLINTYSALILPRGANAFGVFLIRQYVSSAVPNELLDAARIDGCSEFRIFRSIVLPIIKPGLGALTIYLFLNSWNDFMWPLIVLSDPNKYTIPLGLASLIGPYSRHYNVLMAGSMLASAPVLILFLAMQKQFISGLTAGALKT